MIPGYIERATRVLGKPWNWDDAKQGICVSLPILDVATTAGNQMLSAWIPTPDEIERLKAGAPIYLGIIGTSHPPVSLFVGSAP